MEFRGMETLAVEVLRTPELQRLRKVKQLGLVHYVFPGAEHSRLSHSLGAAHLAVRFGRQLRDETAKLFVPDLVLDEHAIADFAVAALCHDLGHGPLSHAWEREIIGDRFDRDAWAANFGLPKDDIAVKTLKWHELIGQGLLAWPDGQLHRLLELQETGRADRIRNLLNGKYYYSYLPRLLHSDVDVDRADFIMRDTHNTGVAYGRFDLNWLISTCSLGRSSDTRDWIVGFDGRKAVRVIEQFLIARQAMYDTVYQHKTVRCIEGMVSMLLRRLKDILHGESRAPLSGLIEPLVKTIRGEALTPDEFLKLDDFSVFVLIDTAADGTFKDDTARDIASRLQARDLFKMVPCSSNQISDFHTSPENIERLYAVVQKYVPGLAKYYLVIDRVRFELLSNDSPQQVMLIDGTGAATKASDHESLLPHRRRDRNEWRLFTVGPAVQEVHRLISSSVSHS
jgi:hypothetical protein